MPELSDILQWEYHLWQVHSPRMNYFRLYLQVSYAIGVAQPLSVHVDTYGTGTIPDREILQAVLKNFDFRPGEHLCLESRVKHTWLSLPGSPYLSDLLHGLILCACIVGAAFPLCAPKRLLFSRPCCTA